jgi:hypothetical protein
MTEETGLGYSEFGVSVWCSELQIRSFSLNLLIPNLSFF